MRTRTIDPAGTDLPELIEDGVRLHGHLGPYLVAGIRVGLLALELLGSPGYFGLRVTSEAGTKPPLLCLSDGIQIGSGCTTGKGDLRRRILLVRALAQEAELLLLDGPTSNLDPAAKDDIVRCVLDVRDELSATTLIVSHEAGPPLDSADRLLTLDGGRIVADRAPRSALADISTRI